MQVIQTVPGAPLPVGPYSPVVISGNIAYLAGQIGLDPEGGKLVEGGVEGQARQVLENLTKVLEAAGSSWDRVCMTTIFLSDISFGPVVNKMYESFLLGEVRPARQTVAVKDLPMGALVEISLIAEVV